MTLDSRGKKIDGSNIGGPVISVENLESLIINESTYNTCFINVPYLKDACLTVANRFSEVLRNSLKGMMPKLLSIERMILSIY